MTFISVTVCKSCIQKPTITERPIKSTVDPMANPFRLQDKPKDPSAFWSMLGRFCICVSVESEITAVNNSPRKEPHERPQILKDANFWGTQTGVARVSGLIQ